MKNCVCESYEGKLATCIKPYKEITSLNGLFPKIMIWCGIFQS